jgi:hypothetical protein
LQSSSQDCPMGHSAAAERSASHNFEGLPMS